MTGIDDLISSDDAFLDALRKIEASYQNGHLNGSTISSSSSAIMDTPTKNAAVIDKNLACSCIITLCKILDNIILEKRYNAKTRSIKLSNKLFKDKVGKVQGGGKCFFPIRLCVTVYT